MNDTTMNREPFKQEDLDKILSFLPYFSNKNNSFGEFYEFEKPKNYKSYFEKIRFNVFTKVKQLNNNVYVTYEDKVEDFINIIEETKFIIDLGDDIFNSPLCLRLIHSPDMIDKSDCKTLRLLTTMIFYRSSHYEEYLLIMINKGIITKILMRLNELSQE